MGDQQECQRHEDCGLTEFDCQMDEARAIRSFFIFDGDPIPKEENE